MPQADVRTRSNNAPPARRQYRCGAETRELLLETTIRCIHAQGYGATSIEAVMAQAGVSRGSVLHQFPSRTDLMSEVADKALADLIAKTRSKLEAIKDPAQRLIRYFGISWDIHRSADSTALTEILLAARWDKALARAIKPRIAARETDLTAMLEWMASDAGIGDADRYIVLARFLNTSIRGFTLQLMYDPKRAAILKSLEELRTVYETSCNDMLRDTGGKRA